MKEDHNPSDFQGRSKKKYESSGKALMWSTALLCGVLLVYGLIEYAKVIISSL